VACGGTLPPANIGGPAHGLVTGLPDTVRRVHAVAYEVEIRIPDAHSLKDRRQVVRSVLAVARERFHVSAAEVGHQNTWQRATLGFAVVASDVRIAEQTVDEIDRYLWSRPELEVLDATLHWLE